MKIFIDKKTLDKLKNGWPVCDVYMSRHKPESKYGNYIEVNLSESTQEPDLLKGTNK